MPNSSDQADRIVVNTLALCLGMCGGVFLLFMTVTEMPYQSTEKGSNGYSVVIDRQIFHLGRVTH